MDEDYLHQIEMDDEIAIRFKEAKERKLRVKKKLKKLMEPFYFKRNTFRRKRFVFMTNEAQRAECAKQLVSFASKLRSHIFKRVAAVKKVEEKEEKSDDVNKEDIEYEMKVQKSAENKYDEEDSFVDDDVQMDATELITQHKRKDPSTEIVICQECKINDAFYFFRCGCWFPYCHDCYHDLYDHFFNPPSFCPTCDKRVKKIYQSKREHPSPYKRIECYSSFESLTLALKKKKQLLYNVFNRNIFRGEEYPTQDDDNSSICTESGCRNQSVYNPLCCHLKEHCASHDTSLMECTACDQNIKNKDFILNPPSVCAMPRCEEFAIYIFNCGHQSRFCKFHLPRNSVTRRDELRPYNMPSTCPSCGTENIVAVIHPIFSLKHNE